MPDQVITNLDQITTDWLTTCAGIPIPKERAYTKLGTVGSRLCFAG